MSWTHEAGAWWQDQAVAGRADPVDQNDGVEIGHSRYDPGFIVIAQAVAGQTIGGGNAPTLESWIYEPSVGWIVEPTVYATFNGTARAEMCRVGFTGLRLGQRILWKTPLDVGFPVSGGSTVRIWIVPFD